jgi:hypothetical protein
VNQTTGPVKSHALWLARLLRLEQPRSGPGRARRERKTKTAAVAGGRQMGDEDINTVARHVFPGSRA